MYRIEGNAVVFTNGRRKQFDNAIADAVDFDEVLVVRLMPEPFRTNENVYGLDYKGNVLWQIPERPQIQGLSPYVGLWRKDTGYIEAFNWNGYTIVLDPKMGSIMTEQMSTGGHYSSRRTASRRTWL